MKFKRIAWMLVALMMMGTAQEGMAQQRKTPAKGTAVKSTTTPAARKKTAAKPAVASLQWEGPAVVDGHLAFMGIPLTVSKVDMKSKLVAKGVQDRRESDDDFIRLRATIDGKRVRVNVQTHANGTQLVSVYDDKTLPLAQAKTRFNALVEKLKTVYGSEGKYLEDEDESKNYEIKVAGTPGTVTIAMFNEDEMEGASNFYQVSVMFGEGDE